MWMQRPTTLRLDLSTERRHGSEDAGLGGVSRDTIGAPPGIVRPAGAAFMPPVSHTVWPHSQKMDEEQAHHQLEDEGLADGVAGQPLHHLAVGR